MSDIKYIIAGDEEDDGEHTRFPCLDMVRYAMAAAVTMLAIAVIALVIHAVLRSEDVRLSVNNGYIGADNLWELHRTIAQANLRTAKPPPEVVGASKVGVVRAPALEADVYRGAVVQTNIGGGLPKECYLGCPSTGNGNYQPSTQVTLQKAKTTNLRVILIANNPGGRTKIDCNDTTVSVIDMQPPYGEIGMVEVGNFTVPPQTTIKMQIRLKNANSSYIWEYYGGEGRFSVMVRVTANVTSYPLGKPLSKPKKLNCTCEPVTVGLIDNEAIFATDQVDCRA